MPKALQPAVPRAVAMAAPARVAVHLVPRADHQVRRVGRPGQMADRQARRVGQLEQPADLQVQQVVRPAAWADRQVLRVARLEAWADLQVLLLAAQRVPVATVALQAVLRHRWAAGQQVLQVARPEVPLARQAAAQTALEQSRVVRLQAVAAAVRKAQPELPVLRAVALPAVDRMEQMALVRRPPQVAELREPVPPVKPEVTVRAARPAVAMVPRMDRAAVRTAAVRPGPPVHLAVAQRAPAAPMASPARAATADPASACLSHSPSSRRCSLRAAAVREEVAVECLAAAAPDRPMALDRQVEAAARVAVDR